MTKKKNDATPLPPMRQINGLALRRLILTLLFVALGGYVLLAWQGHGISLQGTVTQKMVEKIVETRVQPIEAKAEKADVRADKAERRADKAEQKAETVSKKQRHVERQVKPLLPLSQNPAVVEKIVEEHAGLAPTPEMMTPVDSEKRGGLLDFLFKHHDQ